MSVNVLTVQEAAAALKVTTKHIYRQIYAGNLRAYKAGNAIRIRESDLERMLKPIKTYAPARELAGGDAQ